MQSALKKSANSTALKTKAARLSVERAALEYDKLISGIFLA